MIRGFLCLLTLAVAFELPQFTTPVEPKPPQIPATYDVSFVLESRCIRSISKTQKTLVVIPAMNDGELDQAHGRIFGIYVDLDMKCGHFEVKRRTP